MHPYQGQVTSTYLMLKLPGEDVSLTEGMIHFKGIEVWAIPLATILTRSKRSNGQAKTLLDIAEVAFPFQKALPLIAVCTTKMEYET